MQKCPVIMPYEVNILKSKKLIHHLLLTVSLAFGAIVTGTTINAQAQQINNNPGNNDSYNPNMSLNHNQNNEPNPKLINVPNNVSVSPNNNYQTYEPPRENEDNSNYANYANTFRKPNPVNNPSPNLNSYNYNNNYQNNYQNNSGTVNNKVSNIYNNILLRLTQNNNNLNLNNVQNNSKRVIKYGNRNLRRLKLPTQSLKSLSNHRLSGRNLNHDRNWFRDGLNRPNLEARSWVSWHESNHRWQVLSYGGVCVGYFQLNPSYLGYRNGHINLNKRHQVKVADTYVRGRYGNWINAKRFWEIHHWY